MTFEHRQVDFLDEALFNTFVIFFCPACAKFCWRRVFQLNISTFEYLYFQPFDAPRRDPTEQLPEARTRLNDHRDLSCESSRPSYTMVYIRQSQLPGLKKYKYSGVDHSLLSRYVLKPYWWSQVVEFVPLSVAPNAVTLTGFAFVIINILTLLYYAPGLDAECPPWVYASWSVGLFLYQTFDAIDGSQARRTGQSGPLGELFDHGVDAINTSLEVLLFAATMRFGQGWKTVLVLFASLLTFYVQTWDECVDVVVASV